jgi:hypothetical protein
VLGLVILCTIVASIGYVFVAKTLRYSQFSLRKFTGEAPGAVTRIAVTHSEGDEKALYWLDVEYSYTADHALRYSTRYFFFSPCLLLGRSYTSGTSTNIDELYRLGRSFEQKPLRVRYRPDRPQESFVELGDFSEIRYNLAGLGGFFGAGLAAIVLYLIFVRLN